MPETLLRSVREDVNQVLALYEQLIGVPASRTWPMLAKYGYVGALSRLVVSADLQKGFKVLRDSNRLDETFEAVIVRHKRLFAPEVVQAAQWRLEHPYDLL
jgi:hypothetical protein